jgi:hypothetical protein
MNKQEFEQKIRELMDWNQEQGRWLPKRPKIELCLHCHRIVEDQRIVCEVHRLGTDRQHFKHKCLTCRQYVFDGSRKRDDQYQLRPISPNYVLVKKRGV